MNTLSWLIYAAEVSDRASSLSGFLAFLFGIFGATGVASLFIVWADRRDQPQPSWLGPIAALVGYLVIETVLLTASVALPSKTTLYMIAASEAGEQIATSPDAIEMMGDLKAIIKKRLKDELVK